MAFFESTYFRVKEPEDSSCAHCGSVNDTAEHTLYECPHWEEERSHLGKPPKPEDDIVEILLDMRIDKMSDTHETGEN